MLLTKTRRPLTWGVLVVATMLALTACGRSPDRAEPNTGPVESSSVESDSRSSPSDPAPGAAGMERGGTTVDPYGGTYGGASGLSPESPGDDGSNAVTKPEPQPQPVPEPTPTPEPEPETVSVDIAGFAFKAAEVVIRAGDSLVWTNKDKAAHTATGDEFDSGNLDQGETYGFTFELPGEYQYICAYHPSMKGVVKVLPR